MGFMIFWLSIVGLVCAGILVLKFLNFGKVIQDGFSPAFLIPFGIFLYRYLLAIFGFKPERYKSREFLSQLLEEQEIVENEYLNNRKGCLPKEY
jgi:hypothetical protein